MTNKMCNWLKRYDETEGMETAEILSENCVPCHKYRSGMDIFCPDYSAPWLSQLNVNWHEVMHRRGYK